MMSFSKPFNGCHNKTKHTQKKRLINHSEMLQLARCSICVCERKKEFVYEMRMVERRPGRAGEKEKRKRLTLIHKIRFNIYIDK